MTALPPGVDAPAWLLGESAFTTVRTRAGRPLLWAAHVARLRSTCAALGLPAPALPGPDPPGPDPAGPHPADPDDPGPLPAAPGEWGLLRVTVTAAGTFLTPRPLTPGPRPVQGVEVRVTDVQVHPQLGAHKTGSALPYRLAARAAAPAFEGWLTDAAGHVVDGSRTSPLLHLDGELVCPTGGLPSVTRAAFLAGRPHVRRPVRAADVVRATAAWVCGSGVGVVPVRRVSGPWGHVDLPVHWPSDVPDACVWPDGPGT